MKNKGLALIELVIVLILITLSMALVAPSLSRWSRSIEEKSAAKKISGILRYYRSEAVQKGKVQQVLFDADLKEIRVQPVEEAGGRGTEEQGETNVPPKRYPLPEGIQLKEIKVGSPQYPSDFPTIEFYPNGGSNGASIILGNADQKGLRIIVHFLTGMVEVEGAEKA